MKKNSWGKVYDKYPDQKKFKLLQDVIIKETGKETYIISLMHKHKLNCYLVAGEAKPILQNQLKEK